MIKHCLVASSAELEKHRSSSNKAGWGEERGAEEGKSKEQVRKEKRRETGGGEEQRGTEIEKEMRGGSKGG